jgi:hypothetical protein
MSFWSFVPGYSSHAALSAQTLDALASDTTSGPKNSIVKRRNRESDQARNKLPGA